MKNLLQFLMVAVLTSVVSVVAAQDQEKPIIKFEKLVHDFGTFNEAKGVQSTIFSFKNEGKVPLVLSRVKASCGCTTPNWTRKPIAPGETGEIKVAYNPRNRPGSFSKSITVQSNADNAIVVLRIKGKVQKRELTLAEKYPRKLGVLRAKNNYMFFGDITHSQSKTQELELINDTDKAIDVDFKAVPNYLTVKVEPTKIPAKDKGKLIVTYDGSKNKTYGHISRRIYLVVDGENDNQASVAISANLKEDFSKLTLEELANAPVVHFPETTVDFGDIKQGEKKEHTFMVENKGKSPLAIRRVKSSCGCTAVAPSKKVIGPGESAPIKVTFNSKGKRGRQSKSITIITNDPKKPTSTLRVNTNVLTN